MLVLSRRIGESLSIGGVVTVTFLDVHKGIARIGVDAPSNIAILRSELPPQTIHPDQSLVIRSSQPEASDSPVR